VQEAGAVDAAATLASLVAAVRSVIFTPRFRKIRQRALPA
jgi:hypothetical protein